MERMDPRAAVTAAARRRGLPLESLSCMIGRDPAFLERYVEGRGPRPLPAFERRALAMALDLDERRLGAVEPWMPAVR